MTYLDLVLLKSGDIVCVGIGHSCQDYLGVRVSLDIVGSLRNGSPHSPESKNTFIGTVFPACP